MHFLFASAPLRDSSSVWIRQHVCSWLQPSEPRMNCPRGSVTLRAPVARGAARAGDAAGRDRARRSCPSHRPRRAARGSANLGETTSVTAQRLSGVSPAPRKVLREACGNTRSVACSGELFRNAVRPRQIFLTPIEDTFFQPHRFSFWCHTFPEEPGSLFAAARVLPYHSAPI